LEIIVEDGELLAAADFVSEGEFTLILDKTPFYAESGGQVGDAGTIEGEGGGAVVTDCKKTSDGKIIHICKMESGSLTSGDCVTASVDRAAREATMRNHSAAHLLQAALREVLGGHVEQAGSYVDSERLRFDFTHFGAMTAEETERTENIVNAHILEGLDITFIETDMSSAKAMGATALFGEKYGESVRVVKMGGVSCELCGGTHIDNTSKAGLFKIISESSVAAGVRRIEAVTGRGVLEMIKHDKELILNTAKILKANNPGETAKRAEAVILELREHKREIDSLTSEIAQNKTKELLSKIKKTEAGLDYLAADMGNTAAEEIKIICEDLKQKNPEIAVILASVKENKLTFTAACGSFAVKLGANAGALVKQVAQLTGGSGGGRPEFAAAAGKDLSKLDEALTKGEEFLSAMVKK
jgi:alanyl-tRNA synthetase